MTRPLIEPPHAGDGEESAEKPQTILVIDDEASNLNVLIDTLNYSGYQTEILEDGESAIEQAETINPDLILLDIMMPGIDGFEVCRHLRTRPKTANTPVIFMTALSEMVGEVKGLELGAVDYVTKPFRINTILARIKTHLSVSKLQRDLAHKNQQLQLQNEQLNTLYEISQIITAPLQLTEVLDNIASCAAGLLSTDAGAILLLDPTNTHLEIRGAFGLSESTIRGTRNKVGESIAGRVIQSGQPAIVDDLTNDPLFFNPAAKGEGLLSCVSVPLMVKNKAIGTLDAYSKTHQNAFNTQSTQILQMLASQAAISIENAQLFEKEQQLRQQAQNQNKELDAFARTVAHDLKNTLGAVVTFSDLLLDSSVQIDPEKMAALAKKIRQYGQQGVYIVDELLLLAGVRRKEVSLEPLDMANIVRRARNRLALLIEENQCQITLPDSWPVAVGYGPWIEEVWVNYLSNGLKYGGKPPHMELGATPRADETVRFWIKDNGAGIDKEAQEALFTEFARLGEVKIEGHGLGLSIVRRIIKKLGGQVGVDSEVGQGSTFYFTLNRWENPANNMAKQTLDQSDANS